MIEFLYSIDRGLFLFLNQTLANPVGDVLWPLITSYDKLVPVRILLVLVWLWLLIKGGRTGRTTALLLIPLVLISDKLNSEVLKELFNRPRPCHEVDGLTIVNNVRLLVPCGPGNAFPSSHAVNNFAVAFLFSTFYSRYTWAFFTWAALVGLSRPSVGVHYPSDVIGGALVGMAIAYAVIRIWRYVENRFLPPDSGSKPTGTG